MKNPKKAYVIVIVNVILNVNVNLNPILIRNVCVSVILNLSPRARIHTRHTRHASSI